MATRKQITSLLKYAVNDDRAELLKLSRELIQDEKNKDFVDEVQRIIEFGEKRLISRSHEQRGTFAETTVLPDKDFQEFIHHIVRSEFGLDELILPAESKKRLSHWIEELQHFDFLSGFKIPVDNKGIFFGPTGTGKTMAAYCVAHELKKSLFIVNLSSIVSSKLGETSRNLNYVFQVAKQQNAILFLDEVDFFAVARDSIQDHGEARRALISLLQLLEIAPPDLIVIAATNLIHSVDPAIRRRFGFKLEFKLPAQSEVRKYLSRLKEQYRLPIESGSMRLLSRNLSKHNYADIKNSILGALKMKLVHNKTTGLKKLKLSAKDVKAFKTI